MWGFARFALVLAAAAATRECSLVASLHTTAFIALVPGSEFRGFRSRSSALCCSRAAPWQREKRDLALRTTKVGGGRGIRTLRAAEDGGWGWREDTVEYGGGCICTDGIMHAFRNVDILQIHSNTCRHAYMHTKVHAYMHAVMRA